MDTYVMSICVSLVKVKTEKKNKIEIIREDSETNSQFRDYFSRVYVQSVVVYARAACVVGVQWTHLGVYFCFIT